MLYAICSGWCDSSLFVFEFSFIKDKVCEIFNDVLVDIFHEGFDVVFWDFEVG